MKCRRIRSDCRALSEGKRGSGLFLLRNSARSVAIAALLERRFRSTAACQSDALPLSLVYQPINRFQQRWQIDLCDLPVAGVVYRGVSMDQDISEADGFAPARDLRRQFGRMFGQLRNGFTDDLELSLHSGAQHVIRLVAE
jgi:hypothetical protein